MKTVVVYANCQGRGLIYFMKKSSFFDDCVFEQVDNYQLLQHQLDVPIDVFRRANILIYQPLHPRHGKYSQILSLVGSHCLVISFPYIYNDALWPIFPALLRELVIDGEEYPDVKTGSNGETRVMSGFFNTIHDMLARGLSVDDVMETYAMDKMEFGLDERFAKTMSIQKTKEAMTDVKVAEFIETNITTQKLFLSTNHPTSAIFVHCVNQILNILGAPEHLKLDACKFGENETQLPGDIPISRYIIKHFKLKWVEQEDAISNDFYGNIVRSISSAASQTN